MAFDSKYIRCHGDEKQRDDRGEAAPERIGGGHVDMLVRPEEENVVGRFEEARGGGHDEESGGGDWIFRDEVGNDHGDDAENGAAEGAEPCEGLVVAAFFAGNVPKNVEDAGDENENENCHGWNNLQMGSSFLLKNYCRMFKKLKNCLQ